MTGIVTQVEPVTVVVPVWDRYVALLSECLVSVLEQECAPPPQVVVVDNASNVPLPWLPPAVTVIQAPRRLSVGAARNLGLTRVETREVIFCDADDRLLPDAIAFLSSRMAMRPELIASICRYVSWNPSSGAREILERSPRPVVFRVAPHRRLFALANLRYNCFPIVGGILRTEAVKDAGGFGDGDIGEDWTLGAQLAFRGPIEFHREPSFLRRIHSGSLWHRAHAHADYLERCNLLRERIKHDPRVPRWVKAGLPLLALAHRLDVAKVTSGEEITPVHPLLGSGGVAK